MDHELAWSSKQYIGTGGTKISFSRADNILKEKHTNDHNTTFAKLTGHSINNNQLRLTSELSIIPSVSTSTASSVTCEHTSDNLTATQQFQVFGKQCVTCINFAQ
jgi:hypothetical protein